MVTVGRIIRPHGIRGEVVVDAETDFVEERFTSGATLRTLRAGEPDALTVIAARPHAGRWLVGFEGVTSMNDAETLRGCELRIPAEALMPLGPGAFYAHDLVGCQVTTIEGTLVGTVRRVDDVETRPLLAIAVGDEGAPEVLVPLVEGICRQVDVVAKVIVIAPPEGLLEVNARG